MSKFHDSNANKFPTIMPIMVSRKSGQVLGVIPVCWLVGACAVQPGSILDIFLDPLDLNAFSRNAKIRREPLFVG